MYSYGIKNTYRPTSLINNAFGWSTRPQYNRADVPTGLMQRPTDLTDDQFRQQFAYEWFQSSQLRDGVVGDRNLTNPPFVSGASGRIHPLLMDSETGRPARILRGYIRRAEFSAGDYLSKCRLYFMYNPEAITRDYVSYLNQSALDPFNTVYQSGNLVAPPSILDFSFTLFFDRQEEACQADHPGVFVDYQFFDLVVRNVVPQDPNQNSNTLPDNGVMMVNPRDITVVFSPQLSVQGRPLNATVNFEKFTHRMTPTRMTIQLQMRAVYIGPVKDMVEYRKEEMQAEAEIPLGDKIADYGLTFAKNDEDTSSWWSALLGPLGSTIVEQGARGFPDVANMFGTAGDANDQARKTALTWAINNVNPGGPGAKNVIDPGWTNYATAETPNYGSMRHNLPTAADCSGLVTEAYRATGNGTAMNWNDWPGTAVIIDRAKKNPEKQIFKELSTLPWQWQPGKSEAEQLLQPGDLLIRHGGNKAGHVIFFYKYEGGKIIVFDAASSTATPEVGQRGWTPGDKVWYLLRPTPVGSTSAAASTAVWQNGLVLQ